MSRSYRKNPICGITLCKSEKQEKRLYNRKLRRKVRYSLRKGDEVLPKKKEVSDIWLMGKDGKFRFDIDKFPEGMRK